MLREKALPFGAGGDDARGAVSSEASLRSFRTSLAQCLMSRVKTLDLACQIGRRRRLCRRTLHGGVVLGT